MTSPSNKAARLRDLRLYHGLTQAEFALRLRMSQSQLSAIERGRTAPDAAITSACYAFGQSPSFFTAPATTYQAGDLNFRTKKTPARIQNAARVAFGELERHARTIHAGDPVVDLREQGLDERAEPLGVDHIEDIAQTARLRLDVPTTGRIVNVTKALERAGTPVMELANPHVDLTVIDGLSSPDITDDRGVIATTANDDGARIRFTRAHELGHLVLHTTQRPAQEQVREDEANLFAGAFLMPREDAEAAISPALTLEGYAQLKAAYAISIQALIRRGLELKLIPYHRYRSLMIQLSSRGWRTNEPVHVAVENLITPQPANTPADREEPDDDGSGGSNVISLF